MLILKNVKIGCIQAQKKFFTRFKKIIVELKRKCEYFMDIGKLFKWGAIGSLLAYTGTHIYNNVKIIGELQAKILKQVDSVNFEKINDKASSIFPEKKIVSLQKALDSLNFRNKVFQKTRYNDELKKNFKLGFAAGKEEGLHKGDSVGMAVGRYFGFVDGLKNGIDLGKGLKDDSARYSARYNLGWEKKSTVDFLEKHLRKYKDSISIFYDDNLKIVPNFKIKQQDNVKNVNAKKPNIYKNNSTYKPGAKPKGKIRV